MPHTVCIAMLNADIPVATVRPRWATYGQMFHDLLVAAASRISPNVQVESTDYDVQRFEYPDSLADFDGILITGSAASSYEDKEWIRRLEEYVLEVYTHHPQVRIFGSCFGHQLVCQSLLRNHGVRVEKDPNGWELGVKQIKLSQAFRESLGRIMKPLLGPYPFRGLPETMRVQFVHADHVKIPSQNALPGSWILVGTTEHCAVQVVYDPGRILTLQGHFEFNRFVNTEIMKVFGATWKPEVLQETMEAIDAEDDAEAAAEMVLQFFLEEGSKMAPASHAVVGGLLTPPVEA